jgi:tetratricopeptide (TPR) repeat protein
MRRLWPVLVVVLVACNSPKEVPSAAPPAASQATAMITATSTSPEAIEHFHKGEELFNNSRTSEAAGEFAQALKLDPHFALAHAFHGFATPTADGAQEIADAAGATAGLPEPERLFIEALAFIRRGEYAQGGAAFKRLTEIAPGDWRAHYWLGAQFSFEQKYPEAVAAYKKATSLNPNAGTAQNGLGYAALQQGDAEGAIAAFTEYVRILPQEPNPHDSLGEALLAAGRFADAEAAFQKAVTLAPQFWTAYQGIAYTKLYAGDWAGGRAALEKAKAGAPTPIEKLSVDDILIGVALAQHDAKTALQIADRMPQTEGAQPTELAFVRLSRAHVLNDAGRYRQALEPIAASVADADSGRLLPDFARPLKGLALIERVIAEAGLHDAAAAARTSAALDAGAAGDAANPLAQSAKHFGLGMLALSKDQTAEARAHFKECSQQDIVCKWQGLVAAEKTGDTAGAGELRAVLLKNYLRDPRHLLMRARIAPRGATATSAPIGH